MTIGYDDALDFHTDLLESLPVWTTGLREEFQSMARRGDEQGLVRSLALTTSVAKSQVRDFDNRVELSVSFRAAAQESVQTLRPVIEQVPTIYFSQAALKRSEDWEFTRVPSRQEVLFDSGLVVLADPVPVLGAREDRPDNRAGDTLLRAVLWFPLESLPYHNDTYRSLYFSEDKPNRVVVIGLRLPGDILDLTDEERALSPKVERRLFGRVVQESLGIFSFGSDLSPEVADNVGGFPTTLRTMLRVWHALAEREGRVATVEASERRARKAAKRAGVKDGDVNVIYLSHEKKRLGLDAASSHGSPRRHKVRGHWRKQPYGPRGAGQWRWTFVDAHERGTGPMVETRNLWKAS